VIISNSFQKLLCGDVNDDGEVGCADLLLMLSFKLGKVTSFPHPDWAIVGDVNLDNEIDTADFILLKRCLLNSVSSLRVINTISKFDLLYAQSNHVLVYSMYYQ
jgi:hypothetical protein